MIKDFDFTETDITNIPLEWMYDGDDFVVLED